MPRPSLNFFTACITGKQGTIKEKKKHDKECIREHLPDELIIESILTRLPARTLAVCCCVSKSWYNAILNDSRFPVVHYNENKNKVSLVFNLLNVSRNRKAETAYFFSLLERGKTMDIRRSSAPSMQEGIFEPVGFCNGLACVEMVEKPNNNNNTHGTIGILNPTRGESFFLSYSRPTEGYKFLCHGFGFDSLSQVYKVVVIFKSYANDEFLYMVSTLGTMSWRKIVTTIADISLPPGSSPFPRRIVTWVSKMLCRQAGGDLYWRTKNIVGDFHTRMLLSFDLHDEKIRFIRLPDECTQRRRTYLADDHLLEFKGYPCIARSERISTKSKNHCGHRCNYQIGACCCCYKVHMYILKDKDTQVWSREETFDVRIMDQEGLQPTTLCQHFDTSAATPPTRILTFSDQVLMYWFNGERLILYNLQEKHLKVVECSRTYPRIFRKRKNMRCIGGGDNFYCKSAVEYQLHAQVENIVSIKTFIPEEAKISDSQSADDLMQLKNLTAGWLTTRRKKYTFYAFS